MKFIKTYESFKSEKINEEFIGNFLKGLIPDWMKNINVKNKRKIDKAIEEYKDSYEETSKKISGALSSKDEINKNNLTKIQGSLEKKRKLILDKLNNTLSELTKDNKKSKSYANFKRNAVELELVNSELEEYEKMGIDNEYSDFLKEKAKKAENLKKQEQENLKKAKAEENKSQSSKKIESSSDITPDDILIYRNSDNDRFVVKVTEDGQLQRISNIVKGKEFTEESEKADDKKDVLALFNRTKDDTPIFKAPHNDEWDRLSRISKRARSKFTKIE